MSVMVLCRCGGFSDRGHDRGCESEPNKELEE